MTRPSSLTIYLLSPLVHLHSPLPLFSILIISSSPSHPFPSSQSYAYHPHLNLLVVSLAAERSGVAEYRIARLSSGHPPAGPDPISRPSGQVYARSAMTRSKTSSPNTAMRRAISIGSTPLPRRWSGSRWK